MSDNPGGGGLINLGELSKPATVLIEKISDAVGGIAKPWQTVRVAKAEARADLIRVQTKMEISEIEQRALLRMVREEGKRQENIENITAKAIPHLAPDSKPEEVDDDWITHFFERCRLISDVEMQSLWAKMLAGEANKQGAFSKKTVNLVAAFDKSDAELFTIFCTFVWQIGDICPIIDDSQNKLFTDVGINFSTLTHLDDIGLITFDGIAHLARQHLPKSLTVAYYGKPLLIEFDGDENMLRTGHVMLTQMGHQLAPICGSHPSENYRMYVLEKWLASGYTLSSPVRAT